MNEKYGNALNIEQGVLVHGCNAQGKMNSGIAGEIHRRFPSVYHDYYNRYISGALNLGDVVWSPPNAAENRKFWIANGITQEFYGRDPTVRYADYMAIRDVFKKVYKHAKQHNFDVHFPKIGAGLANGEWSLIRAIIREELNDLPHTLWIYENTQSL